MKKTVLGLCLISIFIIASCDNKIVMGASSNYSEENIFQTGDSNLGSDFDDESVYDSDFDDYFDDENVPDSNFKTDNDNEKVPDSDSVKSVCGNGKIEGDEVCERSDTIECAELAPLIYESGTARCLNNCTGWNTRNCERIEFPDDDTVSCEHECIKPNSVKCESSIVKKCELSGGCYKWVEKEDCSETSRLCEDGDTVGFGTTTSKRANVYRGNFIEATDDATIYEFAFEADNETGQPLIFAVYESETSDGTYNLIATRTVDNPGTGRKMFSSGPIKMTGTAENVSVIAGKFYLFGAAWAEEMGSYYVSYSYFSPFVSQETSFGKTLGGTAAENSYPLLSSIEGNSKSNTNYNMFFNTGQTNSDICKCNNTCPALNDKRCQSNQIEKCSADSFDCLSWVQEEDCETLTCNQSGNNAECICIDVCTVNHKRCVFNTLEACVVGEFGCTVWEVEDNCSNLGSTPYCAPAGTNSAECVASPQKKTEYVGDTFPSYKTDAEATHKGVYVLAGTNAVISSFKAHLQSPGGTVDVVFSIYEGDTAEGLYQRKLNQTLSVGANGYYGPENFNVLVTAGKHYVFSFFIPAGTGYYQSYFKDYSLQFGKSTGSFSLATSEEPSQSFHFSEIPSSNYRMFIESYLR
ncbi:MAG: hypothetical protein ACOX2F_11660 [bacterium]